MSKKSSKSVADEKDKSPEDPCVVPMTKEKDCKGSVKYSTSATDVAVSNVYVDRGAFPDGMPDEIVVTVTVG